MVVVRLSCFVILVLISNGVQTFTPFLFLGVLCDFDSSDPVASFFCLFFLWRLASEQLLLDSSSEDSSLISFFCDFLEDDFLPISSLVSSSLLSVLISTTSSSLSEASLVCEVFLFLGLLLLNGISSGSASSTSSPSSGDSTTIRLRGGRSFIFFLSGDLHCFPIFSFFKSVFWYLRSSSITSFR